MPGTVSVGCKMPNGLRLILNTRHDQPNGRVTYDREDFGVLAGNADEWGKPKILVGGYVFTHGIDADKFAEWLKQMADSDILRDKLVIAEPKADRIEASAKDHAAVRAQYPRLKGNEVHNVSPMTRD